MAYVISGRLCGYICDECPDPLGRVLVRFYRIADRDRERLAVEAAAKETFKPLSDDDVKEKEGRLIAEGVTDPDGNFTIEFPRGYEGEAVELDVRIDSVHGTSHDDGPKQFSITAFRPEWKESTDAVTARFEYCLANFVWCRILALFGLWAICGRLTTCGRRPQPIAGATVTALDADWTQDDAVGQAVTDTTGRFLIVYTTSDFRRTPFSPFINLEWVGGPDLYFRAERGGDVLLDEPRSAGRVPGRENVGRCVCVELCTDRLPLECDLTAPASCVNGHTDILAGKSLEPIVGTAQGADFDHYELELLYNGAVVPGAVLYADAAGNPDPAATTGVNQVSGGTLGFVDLGAAAAGAGIDILLSTTFEIRLRVFGSGGDMETCSRTFAILAARAYISYVGGARSVAYVDPNEPLRTADDPAAALATVGGGISVRGAAVAYGCSNELIASYNLWIKSDPTFSAAQPANGSAFAGAGWTSMASVDYTTGPGSYTTAQRRQFNTLDGNPDPDFLTNTAWSTRLVCSHVDSTPPTCFVVPDLVAFYWPSRPTLSSGKYSILLQVVDTAGNTYYDIQRVWIDNDDIQGKIDHLEYSTGEQIPSCTDILVGGGGDVPRKVDIHGYATDPLIVPADLTTPTSDNFQSYTVQFRKQGQPGAPVLVSSTTPVPDRATWTGGGTPPTGVLATWDLAWIDAGSPAALDASGTPIDPGQRLPRGASCTYDVYLSASDSTIVSESTDHHTGLLSFPVKIVNDLP
jgi:hypothetical protein